MFNTLNQIMLNLAFWAGVGVGGVIVWFGKLQIQKLVIGGNALAAKLHAQADKIAAVIQAKKP